MIFMASLCVKTLLGVVFLSGALAGCFHADLFITAPTEMEALSGSCLYIPCNFTGEQFNSTEPISAGWIQEYNYSPCNEMKVTGDVMQKSCTTEISSLRQHHTNNYLFRLVQAVAVCDPVKIHVKDSALSPWIETSPHQLKEKESVTITCSALTPCPHAPPKLTWNLQQDAANNMEENTDRTFTTKIQQTITVSERHDGFNISCSAAYPVNQGTLIKTAEKNFTLSVSYAPKDTSASISPSGLVGEGIWVNLTCSSRANPPVNNFTWFKTSTHGLIRVSGGDVYSFSLTHDTEGDYYCDAENDVGNQTSTVIHVNIKDMWLFIKWRSILGVVFVIALICLFVCVYFSYPNPHHYSQEDPAHVISHWVHCWQIQTEAAGRTEDDIHYEEVNICPRSPVTVQVDEQQQDMVYAQVNVSKSINRMIKRTGDSDSLYAEVHPSNHPPPLVQVHVLGAAA